MKTLPRIVIVGSSFAGYTAALKLAHEFKAGSRDAGAEITVISNTDVFTFMPSLIWVPFGLRTRDDVTFALRPRLEKAGVKFVEETATSFDLKSRRVATSHGGFDYDYLLIGTGPKLNFEAVPGLGPDRNGTKGNTHSICSIDHAEHAHEAWLRLLKDPGPVIVGAVQGASCFGAAYEFVLNLAHQIKRHKLSDKVPITYVSSEPFLGHFGIGGFGAGQKLTEMFFKKMGIASRVNATVDHVESDHVVMGDGERLPYKFAMLIPSFRGVDAVAQTPGLGNAAAMIETDDGYQTRADSRAYAAGVAVAVTAPGKTPVACGVPKTGYLTEEMAKTAAHNIGADILDGKKVELPFASIDAKCILDAGNSGVIMTADHILEPRDHAWLIPGPEAHWAKLAFEAYFMATRKHGIV